VFECFSGSGHSVINISSRGGVNGCYGGFVAERAIGQLRVQKEGGAGEGLLYVGFMLSIFSPALEATNSLLMKRPMGWAYLRPLGAVRVTERSDMMYVSMRNPRVNNQIRGLKLEKIHHNRSKLALPHIALSAIFNTTLGTYLSWTRYGCSLIR